MKHFSGTKLFAIFALLFSQAVFAQQVVKPYAGGTGVSQANTKTLTLSGPNSFTGATVASGQTLTLTGATVAGTPTWSSNQAITLSTAAQGNVTSLGTITALVAGAGTFSSQVKVSGTGSSNYTEAGLIIRDAISTNDIGILNIAAKLYFGSATTDWGNWSSTGISLGTGSLTAGAISGTTGTFSSSVTMPGLASSSAATTGTLCWTTGTGNVNVDTTTTCLLSSGKYKQNDRPLTSGLQQVMALRPVSYMLKPEFNPAGLGEQIGFFAEDVAKVDERLVSKEDDGSPHAVRYMQMSAVIVKAIQELKAETDELRREINYLKRIQTVAR